MTTSARSPSADDTVPRWIVVVLLGFVAVLSCPNLYIDHHDLFWIDGWGPDASLFVALHAGEREGLRFGSDLVFTYGPLGYLQFALYVDDASWFRAVAYQLFAHGLLLFSLFAFARRHCARPRELVWLCFVSTVFLQAIGGWLVDLKIVVAFLTLCFLCMSGSARAAWREALLGAVAAPLFYVMFSGGITALLIVLTYATLSCWQRRPARALAMLLGLLVPTLGLGLLLQGSPTALLTFFAGAFEIASSYVDAVGLPGPGWQVALAVAAWLAYASFLLVDLARGRLPRSLLLLSAGLLFAGFKHGFVRQDAHVAGFFAIWMIVFTLHALSSFSPRRAAATVSVCLALVSFSMTFLNGNDFFFHRILTSVSVGPGNLVRFFDFLVRERPEILRLGHAERRAWLADALSRVPDSDLAPATLEQLGDRSVDVFPWEIALLERHGLRWTPRPVFQSSSASSEVLDEQNEAHFQRADAPDFVLYGFDSVDGPLHFRSEALPVGRSPFPGDVGDDLA